MYFIKCDIQIQSINYFPSHPAIFIHLSQVRKQTILWKRDGVTTFFYVVVHYQCFELGIDKRALLRNRKFNWCAIHLHLLWLPWCWWEGAMLPWKGNIPVILQHSTIMLYYRTITSCVLQKLLAYQQLTVVCCCFENSSSQAEREGRNASVWKMCSTK